MLDQLSHLTWFTTEQALRYLEHEKALQLTERDLFSHCEQGNCVALINPRGRPGKSTSWLESGDNSYFQTVYGDGETQILNPLTLLDSIAASPTTVYLSGYVREKDEPDAPTYLCEEWATELKPDECRVRFLRSHIDSFAEIISIKPSVAPTEEKASHSLVIAALLELLLERSRPNYTQSSITDEIVRRHEKWTGISDSNLSKLFAACNKAAKNAEKS